MPTVARVIAVIAALPLTVAAAVFLFLRSPSSSSGFFVGTMTEFRATEWPVEHRRPVSVEN